MSRDQWLQNQDELITQQKVNILTCKRLKVLNEAGESVPFNNFLQEEQIIIIFVRHFGCIACRAHVDQIWNLHRQIKKRKTRIIFIGNGSHTVIKMFKEDMKVEDAEIYTDPTLEVFDACGMKRGVLNLVNVKSVNAMRVLRNKGYTQASYKDSGSHRQMGGVVSFKKPGKVTYHFISKYLGDFDNPEDWPEDEI